MEGCDIPANAIEPTRPWFDPACAILVAVASHHGAHQHPKGIAEVNRILTLDRR